MPAIRHIKPKYCIAPTGLFAAPSRPNLSIAKLQANIPQMLVTSITPIPTFAAKKANPVTKVPPISPPDHDHHGLRNENTSFRRLRSPHRSSTAASNSVVAEKKVIHAA